MDESSAVLKTTEGDVPLHLCRIGVGGREWSVLHTGATITITEEVEFLHGTSSRLPYGVALWPAAIALAHEVAIRMEDFRGKSVLELGAGTGLPGIVAAAANARVLQTDRQELALHLCRLNIKRNDAKGIEHRQADWTEWDITDRYDWILGSDILYGDSLHGDLLKIFERNLKPTGRMLLSDPFRSASLSLLETLEHSGWRIVMSRWSVGVDADPRPIGVYELTPPGLRP